MSTERATGEPRAARRGASVRTVLALAIGLGLAALTGPAAASGEKSACVPGATRLCVDGSRFEVTASWKTPDGHTGSGPAVALTADTGYFWFFSSTNVEVMVKVLDACSVNRKFWVFAGGLSNVQVDLAVRDTTTNTTRTYHNPQGTAFRPVQDTNAFAICTGPHSAEAAAVGVPTGTTLSLNQNRFRVAATWRTPGGQTGSGQAVQLTDETGYFWFFTPSNVEMVVKVLNGRAL